MAPVTAVIYLPLKTGADPADASSIAASIWQDTLNAVLKQEGAQRAYWSREVENPSMLRLFVDWDSIDHQKKFMESEYVFRSHSYPKPRQQSTAFFRRCILTGLQSL